MKKLLKWVAGIIGVVVLLLVIVAIAAPLLLDPNQHKPRIESLVKQETGRALSIEGEISLSLFPWLGVEIGRTTLGNAPGFEAESFVSVERMEVRVRLLPLLKKKVEMDTVVVNGLVLNLARNANGQTNWDDLATAGPAEASDGPPPIAALAVGGIQLSNARVRFEDAQSQQAVRLTNLKLVTGALTPGRPVQVDTEFDFAAGPPEASGHLSLAARLALDLEAKRYSADGFRLKASLAGAGVPGGRANIEAKGNATFDQPANRVTLAGLELSSDNPAIPGAEGTLTLKGDFIASLAGPEVSANNLRLSGDLKGMVPEGQARFELTGNLRANFNGGALVMPDAAIKVGHFGMRGLSGSMDLGGALAGNLEQRRFQIDGLNATGKFSGSNLPIKGELPISLEARRVTADLQKEQAGMDAFNLAVADLKASGSLSAAALLGKPRFDGSLEVAPFDLRALLRSLGQPVPDTADASALTAASLSTAFEGDLSRVAFKNLKAHLDNSRVAGTFTLGLGPNAPTRFDVNIDALDADRYLPPKTPKAVATPATAAAMTITLPVEQLRALDIEGRMRAGKLKVSGLRLEDVDVGISAKQGKIHLSPLNSALYGGQYAGNVKLDVSSAKPVVSLDERLSKVKIDALLKDLQFVPGNLDFSGGVGDVRLRGSASGDLAKNTFQFKALNLDAALGGKAFPGGKLAFDLQADADVDLSNQSLDARMFQLKFGPMTAKGTLALTQFLTTPKYEATLDVPAFNARSLLATLGQPPPTTADPKALTAVALNTTAIGTASEVSLEPLSLNLDGTRLKGRLALSNLQAALPAARFDLEADQLDADRYLPPATGKAKAGTPGAAAVAIPVDTLRALDLDGRIAVDQLKIANLRLSNVELVAKGKNGKLNLSPVSAQLYQGTYAGNIAIDASGNQPPRISLNEKLSGVQAGQLLKDLQGDAPLSGRADVFARLNASGADTSAMKGTLSGDAGFSFLDGTVKGIDMVNTLCKAFSGLNMTSLKKEDLISGLLQLAAPKTAQTSTNQTEFAELKGTVNISNGLARNEDLSMKSPLLRVGGQGNINLATERVDYLATVALVRSCQGQGGQDFRELAGIPVPVRISGPIASPQYEPQIGAGVMEALSRSRARQPATQAAQPAPAQPPAQPTQPAQPQKPEDLLKDAGKKAVGDLLRGILK